MELRHIRYFIVAAEEEHFGRAAKRLRISQPALSQQIKDLEESLGTQLFERLPRGVSLSSAGRTFSVGARQLIEQLDTLCEETKRTGLGQGGRLRIASNEFAISHEFIADAVRAFRSTYPNVELDIIPMISQKQIDALRAGEIDAGFLYHRPESSREFKYLHIAVDKWVLAMPKTHRLAGRRRLLLKELRDENFITLRRAAIPHFFEDLFKACAVGGLKPKIFREVDTHSMALDLVSVGMGLAFEIVCEGSKLPKGVIAKKVDDFLMENSLDLVWLGTNSSPSLDRFVEIIFSEKKKR